MVGCSPSNFQRKCLHVFGIKISSFGTLFFCDCEGGRELKDEYGLYDSMTPVSAVATDEGLTIAIYLTKPPVRGVHLQEIHLLKMIAPPADIAAVYHGRQ